MNIAANDNQLAKPSSPLVSFIVPVYNVEQYVVECLDSLLAQDYPNIEIVAVDDGSSDGSLKALNDYAASHSRVTVLHQENSGAGVARNKGVAAAKGKYIWFIDPDDAIEPGAVRELVAVAEEKKAEIVLFALARYDSEIKTLLKMSVQPQKAVELADVFAGEDVADSLYTLFSDGPSPCNKFILRSFILDRGLSFQALPRVNDLCFSYTSLAMAKRIHVVNKPYYKYRTNRKGSSQNTTDKDPSPVCSAYRQLQKNLLCAGVFAKYSNSFYRAFFNSVRYTFRQMRSVATAEKLQGILRSGEMAEIVGVKLGREAFDSDKEFDDYCEFWDRKEAYRMMLSPTQSAFAAEMPEFPRREGRKTLGILCGSLRPGGMERAITHLIPMFVQNGFDVVLMTRHAPSPVEYPLPEGCVRIVVGGNAKRQPRYDMIVAAVRKYGIDTVVIHEYYLLTVRNDIDAVHAAKAKAILHHHSVFSNMFMRNNRERALPGLIADYRTADAMITLSDTDAAFFGLMGCRTFRITNPVPEVPFYARDNAGGHTIIWTARFVDGKRPLDAVMIAERVLQQIPDAKLVMLGDGDEKMVKVVNDYLDARPSLRAAVSLEGFQTDVFSYERKADVFLTTTKFDGFSLSIIEAKALGLPVVAYDMPYLETIRPGTGAVSVPQGDVAAAADRIVQIFRDDSYRKELSRLARASYEYFASHDQWTSYSRLFGMLDGSAEFPKYEMDAESSRIIVGTLLEHVDAAFERELGEFEGKQAKYKKKIRKLEANVSRLKKDLKKEKNRTILNKVKSKIRGGLKCVKENGVGYTVKHSIGKVLRKFGIKKK